VQCGGFLKALAPQGTDQIGASVKALAQAGNISGLRGAEDGLDRFALDVGARVYALLIAGEQLKRLIAALLGDLVNGAAIAIGSCRVEAAGESTADRLDIPRAGGIEYAIALTQRGN